ncbi:MAG: (2Fe-2S)-binding protein [Candidatus Nanopelagicales bacterium]
MDESYVIAVNGTEHAVACPPDTPLLWVLRDSLGLLGTRYGCGVGSCGACSVLMDGQPVHSCDTPMWSVGDRSVVTVEGLGGPDGMHPVQRALIEQQAGQCGYCLSGIAVEAAALVDSGRPLDEATVRTALDDHLCRCGAHNRIVRAVLSAADSTDAAHGPAEDPR